jgi:protein translocase SecG subunit
MILFFTTIQVLVSLFLIFFALIQSGSKNNVGFFLGNNSNMLNRKDSSLILNKVIAILAFLFLLNNIIYSILLELKNSSISNIFIN